MKSTTRMNVCTIDAADFSVGRSLLLSVCVCVCGGIEKRDSASG